jgi:hypothetical protein
MRMVWSVPIAGLGRVPKIGSTECRRWGRESARESAEGGDGTRVPRMVICGRKR